MPSAAPKITRAPLRRAGALTLLRNPRALWRLLTERQAPWLPRLLAVFALLYVLMPLDLVPDVIPVLGWLDDLGIVGIVLGYVATQATRYDASRPRLAPAVVQSTTPSSS